MTPILKRIIPFCIKQRKQMAETTKIGFKTIQNIIKIWRTVENHLLWGWNVGMYSWMIDQIIGKSLSPDLPRSRVMGSSESGRWNDPRSWRNISGWPFFWWQHLSEEVVFVGVFLASWAQGSVLADPHGVICLCSCIYAFHALWVCLHSCVMGLRKRGGIIQQQWHAQSPGPYQYLPPDTAGKIRRLVPWNTNRSQEGLRGNWAWNKNSEIFKVLIPGPGGST